MIKNSSYKIIILFLSLIFVGLNSYAQDDSLLVLPPINDSLVPLVSDSSVVMSDSISTPVDDKIFSNDNVVLFYKTDSIKLIKNEIVSNVLTIVNVSGSNISFKINQMYPAAWELIDIFDQEDGYISLAPNDSIFIPVLLIPSKNYRQGSNMVINSILEDSLGEIIGNHFYTIYSDKKISWEANINPGKRVYLKNDENHSDIEYSIMNTGPYEQDFFINLRTYGDQLLITDTLNSIIDRNTTVTLNSNQDTSFHYRLTAYAEGQRNIKRISTLNYIPNYKYGNQKYSLFVESSDPKELSGLNKKGDKIDFIKLPNQTIASSESNSALPLVVDLSAQNLLGDNVFTSLSMRGFKTLNKDASLVYFTQLNYSSVFWNNELLLNSPWYMGYFDKKLNVEIGQVSGNVSGIGASGKGIKTSYRFQPKHNTGAFYVRGPKLFSPTSREAFGLTHVYKLNRYLRIKGAIGRSVNIQQNSFINAANLYTNFSFASKHYVSVLLAGTQTQKEYIGQQYNFSGYLIGLNYNTSFFKKRLKSNVNVKYNDKNFSSGGFERLQANHLSRFTINKKWTATLNDYYFDINSFNIYADTLYFNQKQLNNTLLFNTSTNAGSYQPGIFYNYSDIYQNRIHSRGVMFRYSKNNYSNNFLMSSFFRAGYNDAIDYQNLGNYFIFESSTIVRYKVWSINARYNYGSISKVALDHMLQYGKTPQTIRFNVQNQHMFKNEHFILESSTTFSYNNLFNNQSFGYFPQLYYFTNRGWRFGVNGSYIYSSNNYGALYSSSLNFNVQEQNTKTHNLNFGFTLRKEFNVPIPFVKSKAVNVEFVAFYDLNGNSIKDENEPIIENVIINVDKKSELITDAMGVGKLYNLEIGSHSISLISLNVKLIVAIMAINAK